jgi:hypothetical protein
MTQVILIESNKTMNDLISVNLTSYLGVDLIHRKTARDATSLLDILPSIDLIITNHKTGNEDSANILNEYLIKNNLEINLIVLGGTVKQSTAHTISIESGIDWEKVVSISAKILGISQESIAKKIIPDYVPVPVHYFLNIDSVNCDVFIRIKKSPVEYQYVKRIHNGDGLSKEAIQAYSTQGLTHFYISKDDYKNFTIFLSNRLVNKLEFLDSDGSQKIQLMGEAYDIASREIMQWGFNREIVQLSGTIIENMVKSFQNSPQMSGLLHKVINSKTGILYQRSHMLSIVACEMIKNLGIKDQAANDKIAFSAFFHDILLTDNEQLSKINSLDELEKAKLSEKDWGLVYNHANEASLLIKNHPESPIGADEIIRHHHGTSNGKGFSNAIDKLPNLSQIFIIAHHFVLELIKFKEHGGEPRPITEELFKRYPGAETAAIIKSLERTLKAKK